nr:immunoglobulin heavy chain junction region [Mus musculus]
CASLYFGNPYYAFDYW